jgi:hypothetical protein
MFVSPRIAKLVEVDCTIDEFLLDHGGSTSFETLEHLISGDSIHLDENSATMLLDLTDDLGNSELNEFVLHFVQNEIKLTVSNWKSRLKMKMRLNVTIDEESEFIAMHISEIDIDDIRDCDIDSFENVLQQQSLRIPNEDWLLKYMLELGSAYSGLMGYVHFEFLSRESIDLFFEKISISELNDHIWEGMKNRMRHPLLYNREELLSSRLSKPATREPDSPWLGLISCLAEFCVGNVHEKGIIEITCSSSQYNHCWNVVDYNGNGFWHTTNLPQSWIQFDFKEWIVSLTHYSLKSDGCGGNHLLQWELIGSKDGNTWVVLDREQTNDLNGNYTTKIFSCNANGPRADFYRYIRLQQTGKNSYGDDYLMLAKIEFFGSMMKSGQEWIVHVLTSNGS